MRAVPAREAESGAAAGERGVHQPLAEHHSPALAFVQSVTTAMMPAVAAMTTPLPSRANDLAPAK